jgi:hypothetical protein
VTSVNQTISALPAVQAAPAAAEETDRAVCLAAKGETLVSQDVRRVLASTSRGVKVFVRVAGEDELHYTSSVRLATEEDQRYCKDEEGQPVPLGSVIIVA